MYAASCEILRGRRKYQYSDAMQQNRSSNVFIVLCGWLEEKERKRLERLDVRLPVLSAAQGLSIKETLLRIYFLPSSLLKLAQQCH